MNENLGHLRHARSRSGALIAGSLVLAACGAGFGSTGGSGSGGGPGGPGLPGNPLGIPLEFSVHNDSPLARTETVRVSVPFPQGGYVNLDNVVVSDHQTAWNIMQRWPDGTVRMAQAQFTDDLPAGGVKTYHIARDVAAQRGQFQRNNWVGQAWSSMQIGAQVEDTFHGLYRAYATGTGEVLQETPLVQVRRHRTYHLPFSGNSIGRDYLTSTFYTTEFRDMPIVMVDWIFGNDYLGADGTSPTNPDRNMHPLGGIDVVSAGFLVKGGFNAVAGYRQVQDGIANPASLGGGLFQLVTLQNTWLEDGQTKRYRFFLYFEPPGAAPSEHTRWFDTYASMRDYPIYPLANLRTWQDTAGAGLLGGPIDGPPDALARAVGEYQGWAGSPHFGPWGSRGDPLKTGTTGTPRNGPLSQEFAHAIQADYPRLIQKLEQVAWAQTMRPYHLYGLQVGAEQGILLWEGIPVYPGSRDLSPESLGRRALWANDPYPGYRTLVQGWEQRAHGWEPFDEEHWTNDVVFDYWSITGDEWAKEELRQIGQSLKGLMRLQNAYTSFIQATRAEGWTMQGFAQVYLATGDESIKDYALRRVHEIVDTQRQKNHPSKAFTIQGDYPGTGYPTPNQFFMPWQHGAVLYGYLGGYRFFEDPLMFRICEDVVTTVEYSWVHNRQDAYLGFIPDGLRYYVPFSYQGNYVSPDIWDAPPIGAKFGDSPLGGAHIFLIGGLYTLADWSANATVRTKALQYARLLWPAADNNSRWDKWHYCVPLGRVPN